MASVPLLTRRTCSTGATRSTMASASSTSWGPGAPEGRTAGGLRLDRCHDLGMGVTQDHRSPGAHEVDVLAPVGVDDVGALAGDHEARCATHGAVRANRRVDATGGHRERAGKERLGGRHPIGCHAQQSLRRRPPPRPHLDPTYVIAT